MRMIREAGLDSREFVWDYATGLTARGTREFFPRLFHRRSGHHFTFRRDHVVLYPSDGVRRERCATEGWNQQAHHFLRWVDVLAARAAAPDPPTDEPIARTGT